MTEVEKPSSYQERGAGVWGRSEPTLIGSKRSPDGFGGAVLGRSLLPGECLRWICLAFVKSVWLRVRAGGMTSMISFLMTQAGWREMSQVEDMLPAEPEISPDSALQKLAAYLNANSPRQPLVTLAAEPEPVPVQPTGDADG